MADIKPTAEQLSSRPQQHRSRHKGIAQEDDATKLQFGEFAGGEALAVSEVDFVLNAARATAGAPPPPDNKVYKSTVEYIAEFKSSEADETINAMREPGFLNNFEIAQIINLRPERVEVAVALIPSLERYNLGDENEEVLQSLLEEVRQRALY